jgi:histone chaperone ASF1
MSAVNVTQIAIRNNPAAFTDPLAFEIEYECLYELKEDLEWKMVYVGSAESERNDQVLDSVLVGPVYVGKYKFVFEGNAPDPSQIPSDDLVGVTAVLLTCSYKDKEFIR